MAALCPGVQYGLSTKENFGEKKTLVFVKLTDSAFSAVRQHIQHKNELTACPTIQFLGDQGQLYVPLSKNEAKTFKFSVSSTADMEGPGGSFECVQQLGVPRGALHALGCLQRKLRVHANDDVYETTRQRMTVAEENHKNKCTREIKPNQTDIGRKVKVKQLPGRTAPLAPRNNEPSSGLRDFVPKPSYQSSGNSKPSQQHHNSPAMTNGFGGGGGSSNRPPPSNKPSSLPDIARRPIRERMIQLLAIRPYKKPELFDRLTREGVREKMAMTSVLKQIAFLKNNEYHLNRSLWNDVKEDWPFYTESEKQILKRRKPQNLTPPGSSDGGSSGSGHSPTSTHPGSPPLPISYPKRPGYFDGSDGLPTKRPRISHYQKTNERPPSQFRGSGDVKYSSTIENGTSQRRPVTDSRDASNMNPRSRESAAAAASSLSFGVLNDKRTGGGSSAGGGGGGGGYHSDDDDAVVGRPAPPPPSAPSGRGARDCDSHGATAAVPSKYGGGAVSSPQPQPQPRDQRDQRPERGGGGAAIATAAVTNYHHHHHQQARERQQRSPDRGEAEGNSDNPDYITEYTTIRSPEQRTRYKQEFKNCYDEYRELHAIVDKVSRRFVELEERLNQVDTNSPTYNDIRKQILAEYYANKQDCRHQVIKRKFEYLHEKLSHIKRLVTEYDHQRAAGGRY